MKKGAILLSIAVCMFTTGIASADIFAGGSLNEFTVDFVPISGSTNPASGYGIVNYDYRIGTYEITNAQWTAFQNEYGTVYGSRTNGYDGNPYWTGANAPTNNVSWYEAAQFVNWLNTSTGHQAAYNFTGTQGTSDYSLSVWDTAEAWGGTNLYRHKDAFYFLPTEAEWTKAAYWNGMNLQTWTSVGDAAPTQDGWNYYDNGYATAPYGPWVAGNGSEELNGTYDMMGNVWEWTENLRDSDDYLPDYYRSALGGSYYIYDDTLSSSGEWTIDPVSEGNYIGFRVASVPEPGTVALLALGSLGMLGRRKQ